MINFKNKTLSYNQITYLHKCINYIFGINITDSQLEKLFEIITEWSGECDRLGLTEFTNYITKHFVNMEVPMGGEPKEYIDKFWSEIDKNRPKFVEFITDNKLAVLNQKIQETDGLLDRINKLVDFLDKCDDLKVSAGDVMGYICGYFGITSEPVDEIEAFK